MIITTADADIVGKGCTDQFSMHMRPFTNPQDTHAHNM